jgi:hypothetical protein
MLSVGEFTSGSLSDAHPLALMLPRSQYEEPILVGGDASKRRAVFLGDRHRFQTFQYDRNDNFTGLIVKDVAIELDEETAFDPEIEGTRLGSLVRQGTSLCICASDERSFGRGHTTFPVVDGFAPMPERHRVGFLRWQVVIGQGIEKRVLRIVDVRQAPS